MGEVENIGPGLTRQLIVEVPDGGSYTTACKPGMVGDGIRAPFTVTGTAPRSTDQDAELAAATAGYQRYVDLADRGAGRRRPRSSSTRSRPATSRRPRRCSRSPRTYWERIEPVAESFGDLDPKIDGREDDERDPGVAFTGYHRLEKDLWVDGPAARLGRDRRPAAWPTSTSCRPAPQTVELTPLQLANGAKELLDEVATGKITGEEDRYSHTDLWDFQRQRRGLAGRGRRAAPGARRARPGAGPGARRSVRRRRHAARAATAPATATCSTPSCPSRTSKQLTDAIDALGEPVSQVAAVVSGQ